jgi:PKD repeat protein
VSIRRLLAPAVLVGALVVPGSAFAATWTVDPLKPNTGACDAGTARCKTITQANTAAKAGDTILIEDGTYAEKPLVFLQKNLTVRAAHPGRVRITSAGGDDGDPVITLGPGANGSPNGSGDGAGLDGLIVVSPAGGGPAVEVNAKDILLHDSSFQHPSTSGSDTAVVDQDSGDGDISTGTLHLVHCNVAQNSGTLGAVWAASVLYISDSLITTTKGTAATYDGGTGETIANTLLRSQVFSSAAQGHAVDVLSENTATRVFLNIDSSIVSGGPSGIGILASPGKYANVSTASISVNAVHTTVAGSAKSAVADAAPTSDNLLTFPGDAFVAFDRSIVHGAAQATSGTNHPGPMSHTSTGSVDIVRSDTDVSPGTGVTVGGSQTSSDKALFLNADAGNFHLRADSPAIDQGGTPDASQSQTDVDGDPRQVGSASDLGADEYVNHKPTAQFIANATRISARQTVTFDAAPSRDPDNGDRITEYRWDFGDGQTQATRDTQITHRYAQTGTYTVSLTTVDLHSLVSDVATVAVTVEASSALNRTRPQISVTSPKTGQRISRSKRLVLTGRASDEAGIRRVQVSIRLVRRSAKASATKCTFVKGSRLVRKRCSQAPQLSAKFSGGKWRYRAPRKLHLPRGLYVMHVRATDKTGVASRTAKRTFRIV